MYRTLIFVARNNTTPFARNAAVFPDPVQLKYDTRDLFIASQRVLRAYMYSYMGFNVATSPGLTGVFAFVFSYGRLREAGSPGYTSWLGTVAATRFEIVGSSASAGEMDIVTNTVAVAETQPAARAVEVSATGYHPPVAPLAVGAA